MTTKLKNRTPVPPAVEIAAEPVLSVPTSTIKGIYNSQQQIIVLGDKIGGGGEGTVYDIQGQPDLVAKLYHEIPAPEKADKLMAMARLGTEGLFRISAWPVDVLRDEPNGNVIGFVMNKIGQAEEVHTLHSPKSRLKKFPDASWSFLVHVAANIARAVAALHEQGFVIGDVNPKNILVTKKATVYFLDCDSFQLTTAEKTYRCEGGFPEYTPPELQGIRIPFNEIDRQQEHDYFGLAVVIFQLLFLGRHPYSGRFLGAGEMPLETAIQQGRFAYGTDATQRQMHPPPGTLPLEAIPETITALFRRAFLATDRPKASEWIAPLSTLTQSLQRCLLHSGHYFYETLPECPWCHIETRARIRLFNFNLVEARQYPSAFRLDEIWREIPKLQLSDPQGQHVSVRPQLWPEVIAFTKQRRIRYWIAMIYAGLGGIIAAMMGGFYAAFWLLPLILLTVRWIAGANKQRDNDSMQTLFTALFDLPNHPITKQILKRREIAENHVRELQQKLGGTKENEAYYGKFHDLEQKLEAYETLAEQRTQKLQRLETRARASALHQHLANFEIEEVPSAQINDSMKSWLRAKGIKTAAELREHELRTLGTTETEINDLLNWQRQIETDFIFDPAEAIAPATRLKIEEETEYAKLRLEHEITSSIYYLRNLKQEIETRHQQILPTLTKARQNVAEADKNLEVMIWRNSMKPITIMLLLAFFITLFVQSNHQPFLFDVVDTAVEYPPPHQPESHGIQPGEKIVVRQSFDELYQAGKERLKQNNLTGANDYFEMASSYVDAVNWKPSFADLYFDMYSTSIKLGKANGQIQQLEYLTQEYNHIEVFHVRLIILYSLLGREAEANDEAQILARQNSRLFENLKQALHEHGFVLQKTTSRN